MSHPQTRPAKVAVDIQNSPLAPLAAAIGFALTASAMPLVVSAEEAAKPAQAEPRQLPKLVASDADEATPKVDTVYSPKFTEPLINIPQTVTVVPQVVLQQQGARTLTEALRNTPGITMQLGENGNTSAGDTFSIRGTSAQSNIFVDGIRDLGTVTRDTFNVDQVEIFKGAVGADNGRGAIAGYVNMVSKQAQLDEFRFATVSANSGHNYRATADMNTKLSGSSAMRANVMWQKGGVPGRDVVEDNRYGFAPSFAFGLGTATRVYLSSQHVRADNVPDGGIPAIGYPAFYNVDLAGVQPAKVDTKNFYGRYDDYEKIQADMATVRIEHDFSNDFKLINTTRYGRSDMDRVLTGINALTIPSSDPSSWTVARNRQVVDQRNDILTNQTNLRINLTTGMVKHELATGVELIREGQTSLGWTGYGSLPAYLNGGTALNLEPANLYHPDPYFAYTYFTPARTGGDSDGTTKTAAGYVFDTLKFGERWLVNAGVRYERYDTDFYGVSFNNTTGVSTITDETKRGWLLSWKTGVVFKPTTHSSLYVSASNTRTPPGSDNFTLASAQNVTNSNPNIASLKPQEARNYEVGVKWDVLNEQLSLNAAVYRTDNQNQITGKDPNTGDVVQYGKRRVQGVELGAVGKITEAWQILAGVAWSDNEQVSGDVTTGSPGTGTQNLTGSTARWAPEYSGNLWTTYTLQQWNAGLGVIYVSEQKRVTNPAIDVSTAAGLPNIAGYTVFDGMVGYTVNSNVSVQLNVYNLLNKDYLSSLNNGGSRLRIGAPRYAQLTATVKF